MVLYDFYRNLRQLVSLYELAPCFNPIKVTGGGGGGGQCAPSYRFLPDCAKTACSRLMKLSDF